MKTILILTSMVIAAISFVIGLVFCSIGWPVGYWLITDAVIIAAYAIKFK